MIKSSFELERQVAEFCAEIGRDPLLVQGAGGNVSWKQDRVLHIKASGTWLADALDRDIFVPVDLVALRQALVDGNYKVRPHALGTDALRPSIETALHALMPQRIVMHLHAIEALAHLVRADAEDIIRRRVGERLPWVLADYRKPGAALAKEVHEALQRCPDAQIVFLRNHGVVVGAESVEQARGLFALLDELLATRPLVHAQELAASSESVRHDDYHRLDDEEVQRLALCLELFGRLEREWALYPDHVVFLGPQPHVYQSDADFIAVRKRGAAPELAFIAGSGVFARKSFGAAKIAQLRCYYDVLVRQVDPVRAAALSAGQIDDLLKWEAEQYRMNLAK